MTSDTERVLRMLQTAWPNPMTYDAIRRVLGMSRRRVEKAAEILRHSHPICADGDGLLLAQTANEAEAYYQSRRRRRRTELVNDWHLRRVVRAMRAAEAGYGPQETLWKGAA